MLSICNKPEIEHLPHIKDISGGPDGCPSGHRIVHDPLYQKANCILTRQQVERGDAYPLMSTGEATPEVLCPILGSLIQKRHGSPGQNSTKGHENGEGTGASLL